MNVALARVSCLGIFLSILSFSHLVGDKIWFDMDLLLPSFPSQLPD